MVSNNPEAKILVGKKEVFVTVTTTSTNGSVVNSPAIQFVDVGTKLFVSPTIKPDGNIQLKIRPEISTAEVDNTSVPNSRIPIVSTTEAETNVLVKSGATLIIGGLIETKDERSNSQIPVLGDIPIIGVAFRGSSVTKKKSEIVVFLTPQIILPDGTAWVPASEEATAKPQASSAKPQASSAKPQAASAQSTSEAKRSPQPRRLDMESRLQEPP